MENYRVKIVFRKIIYNDDICAEIQEEVLKRSLVRDQCVIIF